MSKRKFDWVSWQEHLDARAGVLVPFRAYLAAFFAAVESPPEGGYHRRPRIGLRLELDCDATLCMRPAWTPPHKRVSNGEVTITKPGKIDPEVITLELLDPRKWLSLRLDGQGVKALRVRWDVDANRRGLRLIADAAHAVLTDPMTAFSRQADHCCLCGRGLSDVVSRTRGIGPECIREFAFFEAPPRITAVDVYRQQYYADNGFLPYR